MSEGFKIILIAVSTLGAIVGLAAWSSSAICHAKTKDIGYQSQWGLMSGCLVKKDGDWIPLENFRSI